MVISYLTKVEKSVMLSKIKTGLSGCPPEVAMTRAFAKADFNH